MGWSWTFHVHPEVWVLCSAMLGGYLYAVRVRQRAHPMELAATPGQVRWFVAGVLVLFVSASWPIHDLAEGSLYSVHMIQHMLMSLVAPPMLLAGMPAWLTRALLPPRAMRVVRALSRPLIALLIFNVVVVFTHWPLMVEASVRSEPVHFLLHAVLFGSAMLMWMPVFSPVIEIPRLSYPGQMMYLFLQSLVPTVPASFLTFTDRPLYQVYALMPKPWGISPLEDQRAAGLIMKIVGGAILWGVIAVLFFRWAKMERTDGVDAFALSDVERSMKRMELKKG